MTFRPSSAYGPAHFWSLAVEEHFYLIWPLFVLLLDTAKLLKLVALAIGISVMTRVLLIHYETFYFTLSRLDGLSIGAALAIFARQKPEGLSRFVPLSKWLLCILGPTLAFSQLLVTGHHLPVVQVLKSTLIALLYASFIVLAIENKCGKYIGKALASNVLGSIGKYSYGMYVFHPFILIGLRYIGIQYSFLGLLTSILVTYLVAWLSWTFFESRFLRLKSHFEYRPKQENSDYFAASN
jgi:peptidoglycan/LPS O-acetylase OafA/YrhL